jgi:hypothetical protein
MVFPLVLKILALMADQFGEQTPDGPVEVGLSHDVHRTPRHNPHRCFDAGS